MSEKIILATAKTCGPCHALKSKIAKLGLDVEIREYSLAHVEWFNKHNIRAVPRLVIENGDEVEIVEGSTEILERLQQK